MYQIIKKTLGLKHPSALKDFKKKISKVQMTYISYITQINQLQDFCRGKFRVFYFAFHYK